MEYVEIIELTEEIIKLRYYPEQSTATGEYGEVTYLREVDDWNFDKLPEGYLREYAIHAVNFIRKSRYPKSGLIGWY